jgi:hypothetical protein
LISTGWAEQEKDRSPMDPIQLASLSGNPLMRLPGMQPILKTRLPGMRAFPREIITDVINVPNPFDSRKAGLEGQTQISYTLAQDVPVQATLYDLLGNRVRRWEFASAENGGRAGANQFWWDGTNESGQKVSKGGYLAQIEIETSGTVATAIRKIGVIH